MIALGWRTALWIVAIAGLAYGFHLILSLDEPIEIDLLVGVARTTTGVAALMFLALLSVLVLILGFLLRGVLGLGQVWAWFQRLRFKRGLRALSETMIALAEEDGKRAQKAAAKAESLIGDPDLTRLITAQAAKLAGDEEKAGRYYERMAEDRDTSFLGAIGLMRQALAEDKTERALALAERAHALRPKNAEAMDALLTLQRKKGDWSGARETIRAAMRAGRITRDVADRRRAVLHVTEALALRASGDAARAREEALAAIRLAPALPPAATLGAELLAEKGEKRGAARLLIAGWRIEPHPEIAASFASLEPEEGPAQRLARFDKLFAANPDHEQSRLLKAEIALAADDYETARTALGDLPYAAPSARACALMAAVEQATGAGQETVRAWLASAAAAPRSSRWVCDNCGGVAERWAYCCPRCDAFDSLEWKSAEEAEGLSEAALFPLLNSREGDGGALRPPARAAFPAAPAETAAPQKSAEPQPPEKTVGETLVDAGAAISVSRPPVPNDAPPPTEGAKPPKPDWS